MIRIALFGAGRIGALHAANIAALRPRAELAWIYDTNAAAAEAVAARFDHAAFVVMAHLMTDGVAKMHIDPPDAIAETLQRGLNNAFHMV